jgi:hypothetical protein
VAPEVVRLVLGFEPQQHPAVTAGVHADVAAAGCAGDDVGNGVAVGVARAFDAGAEFIARRAVGRPQQFAGLGRVDIDPSGVLSANVLRRRGGDNVRHAVAIDVADVAGDPAELVVARFAIPLANDRGGFHEGIGEILRRRKQRGEARVGTKRLQRRRRFDLRHVDLAGGSGLGQPREGRIGIVLLGVDQGDAVVGRRHRGGHVERAAQRLDRAIELLALLLSEAEQAPRAAVAWLARHEALEDANGAVRVLGLQPGDGSRQRWSGRRLGPRPRPRGEPGAEAEQKEDGEPHRSRACHAAVIVGDRDAKLSGSCGRPANRPRSLVTAEPGPGDPSNLPAPVRRRRDCRPVAVCWFYASLSVRNDALRKLDERCADSPEGAGRRPRDAASA